LTWGLIKWGLLKGLSEIFERAAIGDRPLNILPLAVNINACEFLAVTPKAGKH
jgi:hypothetical protein